MAFGGDERRQNSAFGFFDNKQPQESPDCSMRLAFGRDRLLEWLECDQMQVLVSDSFVRTAFSEPFQFLPFVVRRDRLDEVGGFPDQTISAEINLTHTMLTHGYRTSRLNEPLSFGLSAEGIAEYVTQRARWCLGTIQVALLRNGPLLGRGFSFTQRWHYLHGVRREHFPHGTTRLVAR
jgi:hypothetical protein